MNIAVISPMAKNSGNTTLAMLIALDLAHKGKKICLTHTSSLSMAFYNYFSLKTFEDKTTTPSLIVKLLKEGGVQPEEVSDYCKKIDDNLELFCNESTAFTKEDMNFMLSYLATKFPSDYVIFDVDAGQYEFTTNEIVEKTLKLSDIVIINITQSINQLQYIKEIKDKMMSLLGNKPILVVINKFCDIQSTIKETAAWMGVKKPNNWLLLRYNPWIGWATNHGQLLTLYKKMVEKDMRVVDIAADLNKISTCIMKVKAPKKKVGASR